jgi:putative membrane protein
MQTALIAEKDQKNYQKLVNVLSIAIPIAVALLIGIPQKFNLGSWTRILPHVIGVVNTLTAFALIVGLIAIKGRHVALHRRSMLVAFGLGSLFLVLYILYHISNPSTPFGGTGWIRPLYYFLLISHISLSIGVVRFVLLALYYALSKQFERHKKVTRWAYPIWLYVSVTGVVVYLMISPYYQ